MTLDRADLAALLILIGAAIWIAAAWIINPALAALGIGLVVMIVGLRNLH